MPMILAMNGADFDGFNGFGDFGDFGAASQVIVELQTALVALGKGIGDNILSKIVVDGLIGPKTVAATNRALTVHLGSGQAPSNLRTGSLAQSVIVSQASNIASLIEAEVKRRGFNMPTPKKVSAVAKPKPVYSAPAATTAMVQYTPPAAAAPTAVAPVYRVPVAASSGMDMAAVIKWAAIGVGAVAVLGIGYYIATKPSGGGGRGIRARTGVHGGMGAAGGYKTFIRSGRSFETFSRSRRKTVDTGLTYDEAKRAAQRFNAERSPRQVRAGTKMEFI